MIKYIGILMLFVVCVRSGFLMSQRLKKRSEFLTYFISALFSVETEICFSANNLKSIFLRLGKEENLHGFFSDCYKKIDEEGIKKVWDQATDNVKEKACLNDKDINIIRQLGKELGMSDIQGQKSAIERVCSLLKTNEAEARDEYIRLSAVYRKCGFLAGIFIAIVMI